jgi:hypothetical protein
MSDDMFDDQTNNSLVSFFTRLQAFEDALAYAAKIDGCASLDCKFRNDILGGKVELIAIYCDICPNKYKA